MKHLYSFITAKIVWVAVVIAILMLVVFYYFINPESSQWMPRCMFHDFTGWSCPGCGMQRAVHYAVNGDFSTAWRMNYALPFIGLIIVLYAFAEFMRKRFQNFYLILHHPIAILVLFVLTLVWWVGRNVAGV